MRLGAPIMDGIQSPEEWVHLHQRYGYRAACSWIHQIKELNTKKDFLEAAEKHDIIFAEIWAWCNPMSLNSRERKKAIDYCKEQLFIADESNTVCCVNITGDSGEQWSGDSNKNLRKEMFDLVVETTRDIIDSVKPKRTYYTIGMTPWMYPYDEDSYLDLIKAVDRQRFAVHLDIANTITSPMKYHNTTEVIKSCFAKLGKYIKCIHIKDIIIPQNMIIEKVVPGKGIFNHKYLIEAVRKFDEDIPLMLANLSTKEEYMEAGEYIKSLF